MKCRRIILWKENWGLIILPVKCKITFNRKVETDMNEVFETLSDVFEELRSESEDREFLEDYMDAVDHAHYKEEQRAYYQGFVDSVQVLDGLGIIKKRMRIKELLKKFSR